MASNNFEENELITFRDISYKIGKDYKINVSHYELEGDFNERFELENFPLGLYTKYVSVSN